MNFQFDAVMFLALFTLGAGGALLTGQGGLEARLMGSRGIDQAAIVRGLESFAPVGGRLQRKTAANGATVIDEDLQIPEHPWASRPWNGIQDSVVNLQRHWIECLRTGRTPETSGADTLRTMELTLGAYESLVTGLPYRVSSAD